MNLACTFDVFSAFVGKLIENNGQDRGILFVVNYGGHSGEGILRFNGVAFSLYNRCIHCININQLEPGCRPGLQS